MHEINVEPVQQLPDYNIEIECQVEMESKDKFQASCNNNNDSLYNDLSTQKTQL